MQPAKLCFYTGNYSCGPGMKLVKQFMKANLRRSIMPTEKKFAILIDADNISEKYIKTVLDEISNDGVATYKRIYGDWTSPSLVSWKKSLLDHSIIPIQQYSYTSGKNSTDSAMIIDAMDILYSGQVDGFCLVSSDSDFTRLAARLRESGMTVVGMGERKTPKSFIAACNRFKYLDILSPKSEKTEKAAVPKDQPGKQPAKPVKETKQPQPVKEEPKELSDLEIIAQAIKTIAIENSDEDDWTFIGTIGNLLVKRYPDFDVRNFGYNKFAPFIESLNLFDVKSVRTSDSNGKLIYIRPK